jgi:predicted aldo/keto reductase-like oxidoreductase
MMEKMRLGRTEMMVTKIGFGGIPIQRVSEDEAIAVVKRCLELGINFLDTANGYTTSEERIGKAISGKRDGLMLATKSMAQTREGVESHLKLSLERLSIESIDLYQFHNVSNANTLKTIIDPTGPMAVVQEAKRAGVVKHIGITSHQIDVAKEAVKSDCFDTIMFPFNFVTREATEELLPLAREHDVGFISMKPLAGGMLDNVTLAIKYLLQFPDVVFIPGIEKIPEIDEITQVLKGSWEITALEQEEMERLRQELGTRFCRRCDYCQPCTVEIPISDVMSYLSATKRLPPVRLFTGNFAVALEKVTECTECGECEEKCPYHLSIRETIAGNYKLYQAGKKEYQARLASK